MEAISMRFRAAFEDFLRRIDWSAVWAWVLGFGLVAYLGLEGGGYDPLVHDQVGIAVWWVLLAALLVGAIPRHRLGPIAWGSLGLLAVLVAWTALSLSWTESVDRTFADLARITIYLGVFALALFTYDARGARPMIAAVGTGIALVAVAGLLSRLHPAWFPEASQTGRFLAGGQERLSYPVNYWNALGALIAVGLPSLLHVATSAKAILFRALAAAALPAMALTAFLTLSRGGIGAAIVALAVFLAFTSDRLPKLLTLLVAAGGSAILISAAEQRDALQDGLLNAAARQQGDEMVPIVLGVCLGVGLLQGIFSWGLEKGMRPRWTFPSRSQTVVATGAGVLVALVALVAFNAPGHTSDAWTEFKEGGGPGEGSERLTSFAGQSRYLLWKAAVDENASEPLRGTGSGTFEFWWARNGEGSEVVRDTHSLYLQVLGELGIVGLVLLGAFLSTVLVGGGYAVVRAGPHGRSQLAAALAGCIAFCLTAAVDWMWQIPVLPVAMVLLASSLVTLNGNPAESGQRSLRLPLRLAFAVAAVAAIVATAIPLASTALLRQSEADAREGNLPAALSDARSAQDVLPGAAAPRLQEALLLEEQGDFEGAAAAAHAATEREPTNWRNWLVLSRIEAQRGKAAAAVRDFRKAKSLNPHFSLFE